MESYERYIGVTLDDRYRIEKIIGIGGMAVVFKAEDLLCHRWVAVKMLKDEVAADEGAVQRFINESKAVAMLNHPNIVNIYDVSVTENLKYIVMEFVDGITLKNYMNRRGPMPYREILSYTEQILRALAHAHSKGIIHRDIKPQNIMLLKSGVVKVADFGIAKLPNAETVTMTDKAIGTVYYISPEQASGGVIDSRSDLYSLGVMMYEMAAGKLPFNADNPVTVAMMQINAQAEPLTAVNPALPKGLAQVIETAMAKDPAERYQSAETMMRHVRKLLENPRVEFVTHRKNASKKHTAPKISRKYGDSGRDSHSMLPIILGVAVSFMAIAAACGLILLSKLLAGESASKYEEVAVHNFVNSYYSDEMADYFAQSDIYALQELKYAYDADVPAGYIIEQEPKAGVSKKILRGKQLCELTLTISTGAETVVVPDYLIQDYRAVRTSISRSGLQFYPQWEYSDTVEYGYVIRTSPAPGETVKINTGLTVVISKGAAPGNIRIPSFANLSEVEAMLVLTNNGLEVGNVTYAPSEEVAEGLIISQSPVAGTTAVRHTAIDLVISTGQAGIPLPNVVNMKEAAAILYLSSYGLQSPTVVYDYNDRVAAGVVYATDPPASSDCRATTPITVYVSRGPAPDVTRLDDYSGMDYTVVESVLEAKGYYVTVQWQDSTLPENTVVASSPVSGTVMTPGDTVTLYVSRGQVAPEYDSMPDFTGWAKSAAADLLTAMGFTVGYTYSNSPTVAAGLVMGQTVTPGTPISIFAPKTLVELVISTGS